MQYYVNQKCQICALSFRRLVQGREKKSTDQIKSPFVMLK
jgi:hypothetical protein